MEQNQIERLLASLPNSEDELLLAVQTLERQDRPQDAQGLLTRALERGASERIRLELSLRLIEGGQPAAALKHLDALQSPRHPVDLAILRAVANHALLRFAIAEDELNRAEKLGLPDADIQAWRNYLTNDVPPPRLPYRQLEEASSAPFQEAEPTHLIDLNAPAPHTPAPGDFASPDDETVLRPSLRLPQTAAPDDETILRSQPALSPEDLAVADEETIVRTFPKRALMPDTVERAAEMPRYSTQSSPLGSPQPKAPSDESSPFLLGAMAAMPFDLEDHDRPGSPEPAEELELELDLSHPSPDKNAPQQPDNAHRSVRQLTVFLREKAPAQFTVILRSPARALTIAALTALMVLITGVLIIYSTVGNARLRSELQAAQIAIDADLYSSHLATVRDLNRLQDFQVLPSDSIDGPLQNLTSKLPLLSFDDKLTYAQDLAHFTRARQSFRFEHPGSLLPEELPQPTSPLIAAAHAYLHLSYGQLDLALKLLDEHLLPNSQDPNINLAITDILVEANDQESIANFVDRTAPQSAATAFLQAKALLLVDDERAQELISAYATSSFPDHVGLQLTLASLLDDPDQAEELLNPIIDPGHPHASRSERAQALIQQAALHRQAGDQGATLRELERAAQTAPLNPQITRHLIDHLLEQGQILDARTHLSRQPQTETRHPYFDLAIARIHHLIGDLSRAEQRLKPHLPDHPEAAARQALISAKTNDLDGAQKLLEAIAPSPDATITRLWITIAQGPQEDLDDLLKDLPSQEELSPQLRALHSDALRLAAGHATSRKERQELLSQATQALGDQAHKTPETRIQACLIALDLRDQPRSDEACQPLADRDIPLPKALKALIRWHLYEGRSEEAQATLEDHIHRTGPSTTTRLLQAHHHIRQNQFDEARAILEALPAADLRLPGRHIAAGLIATYTGQFDAAAEHFQSAIDNSALHQPQAILGLANAHIHLDDTTPDLEPPIRSVLRHGEFGPQAWTTFAALRRTQNRLTDARENIALATQALASFGSPQDEILILTEQLAQAQRRRGPGHRAIRPLLLELEDLGADHWHYHSLAARWHQAQRRPNRERLNHHLDKLR